MFAGLFGIVLPAATVAIELYTRMCAETFFDPIPTLWHAVLAALVPAANLALVWALIRGNTKRPGALFLANGVAIGVSGFYALLFLPLAPLAAVAVVIYGLGLLPFAPLFGLISALMLRRALRRQVETSGPARATPSAMPRVWRGIALAAVAMVLVELPVATTRVGMHWAASSTAEDRSSAIRFLRTFGSEEVLLWATSARRGRGLDLVGVLFSFADPVSPVKAKEIYYRVTGQTPQAHTSPGVLFPDFDPEQGGSTVGNLLPGLSLAESRLDGSIDAGAGLAYSQWTMVIANAEPVQREGRAQLKLPAGAVVSRVTLWINGEEREAAFGPRARVREAYERVVRAARDPLLVTTNGADRVLIQCFPVPAQGEMKIRIGITQPLESRDRGTLLFSFPHFTERNFGVGADASGLEHQVWIEADSEIAPQHDQWTVERFPDGAFAVRGSLEDSALRQAALTISSDPAAEHAAVWTPDPLAPETHVIQQRFERTEPRAPEKVVVVIDGSVAMRRFLPHITDALSAMPRTWKTDVLVATDEVQQLDDASDLRNIQLEGGTDNVPALQQAYRLATVSRGAVILWVHGFQPVLMDRTDGMRQNWERRPGQVPLFAIQGPAGPNRILESLDGIPEVQSVTRTANLSADLLNLWARWAGETAEWVPVRQRRSRGEVSQPELGQRTSPHLAKLWAADEVGRLSKLGAADQARAASLATSYQIVTPVSGAVVLETQTQYDQAGLQPADPANVPTIPEPEVWALMLILTLLLGWQMLRGRGAWKSA